MGTKVEAAPLESLATNTKGSVVSSSNTQRKIYSPSPTFSRVELAGSPPTTSSVKLSPVSTTVSGYRDSSPRKTEKTAAAVMLGAEFSAEKEFYMYFCHLFHSSLSIIVSSTTVLYNKIVPNPSVVAMASLSSFKAIKPISSFPVARMSKIHDGAPSHFLIISSLMFNWLKESGLCFIPWFA